LKGGEDMKRDALFYSILFAVIYFVQGTGTPTSGIAAQPIQYLLKDVMLMTAAQSAYFLGLMSMAWNIKPLYGLVSDFLPLGGYRRKSWLILMNVIAFSSWILLVLLKDYVSWQMLPILMACSLGFAFTDVVGDGLMVQTGKPLGLTGRFQAIQWGAISFASIMMGIGGGWVATNLNYKTAFMIASVFPLITIITTLLIVKEEKVKGGVISVLSILKKLVTKEKLDQEENDSIGQIKTTFNAIKEGFKNRVLWGVILFIFCWNFSPSFGTPFFYYMRDELHFSKMFIGVLGSIGSGAGIVGAVVFFKYCKDIPLRYLLRFTVALGTFSTLTYLLIVPPIVGHLPVSPAVFIISTGIVFGTLGMIGHLALLDMSAKACPKFAEGTVFAALMSVFNIGSFGSTIVGGWLYDIVGMMPLILVSTAFTAACWFLIKFIDVNSIESNKEEE